MLLFNKINWNVFLFSLCLGLFFCYIFTPEPSIVIKYPTPENTSDVVYVDKANNCYKYKATEVECPQDIANMSPPKLDI